MKLTKTNAETYIPSGMDATAAISRTTDLHIGAHHDDTEAGCYGPLIACYDDPNRFFSTVVVSDGAGSARTGMYADITSEQLMEIRVREQRQAADIAKYSALFMLAYPSREVKDPSNTGLVDDLKNIISACKPDVIYTHNPSDKHETHLGVCLRTVAAIRQLPKEDRPKKLYGMEGWRNIDWLDDSDKVTFDTSPHPNLAAALIGLFDSQIAGGKRYDIGIPGGWAANATHYDSHSVDTCSGMNYAIDMTPLIEDDSLDILGFINTFINKFVSSVAANIGRFS